MLKSFGKKQLHICGAALLPALVLIMSLTACGGTQTQTQPEAAATAAAAESVSLDLANTGLSDISDLLTRTDLISLDLRGDPISTEQYEELSAALPDCEILWSVPVGDEYIDSDAVSAAVSAGPDTLEAALSYLPNLSKVEFADVTADDYAALSALAARYAQISFAWNVTICDASYPQDTKTLDLSGVAIDSDALGIALGGLPALTQVRFAEDDAPFTTQQQLQLAQAFPDVAFFWNVTLVDGFSVYSDATEVDLRGYTVSDADAFSDTLVLLPELTYADMCNCGLTDDQMVALRERYPETKFVWLIRVNGWEIRTDIKGFSTGQRYDFPDGAGGFVGEKHSYRKITNSDLEKLTLCTDLVALDVGHCTKIGNIDFIAQLPKLKYLVVSLCDITDISPLAEQTDLEFLEIKYNYLTDLSPLANCTKIRYLNCSNNEISDFSVVKNMPNLERLWISMNNFTMDDVAQLQAEMPNTVIKASLTNPEYAESLWRKGNEGYLAMQALFGMRAQNQG